MTNFVFFLFFLLTLSNGEQASSNRCGRTTGAKYKLYQYEERAEGAQNNHLITPTKESGFDSVEVLGSVLTEMDPSCNCLIQLVTAHKETSWFGFAKNIDNILTTNDTIPASYTRTQYSFVCATEENACGASVAMQYYYNAVKDDHFCKVNGTLPNTKTPSKDLGIMCYIWPASEGDVPPTTTKAPTTAKPTTTKSTRRATTKKATTPSSATESTKAPTKVTEAAVKASTKVTEAAVKASTKANEAAVKASTKPTETSKKVDNGDKVKPAVPSQGKTQATLSSGSGYVSVKAVDVHQEGMPAVSVDWDPSKPMSTMERAMLYIKWYNASIEYINKKSNGTPEDYRRFMPYYPGPEIFPNNETSPEPETIPTQRPTKPTTDSSPKPTKTVSRPHPASSSSSPDIHGPWPQPSFNFESKDILEQLKRMNLTLDELKEAYQEWLYNCSIWLAQYYGPEWILPNGTHIKKRYGHTADKFNGNSPLDETQLYTAYDEWLGNTKLILNNLMNDNGRYAAFLNSQPSKDFAHNMLNHLSNPPPAHTMTQWPAMPNVTFTGEYAQKLQEAYEKWLSQAKQFTKDASNHKKDDEMEKKTNKKEMEAVQKRLPVDIDVDKLVKGAIPDLLNASNNGTDRQALHAAYHSWLEQTQQYHANLAQSQGKVEN